MVASLPTKPRDDWSGRTSRRPPRLARFWLTLGLTLRQSIENLLHNPQEALLPTLERGFIALFRGGGSDSERVQRVRTLLAFEFRVLVSKAIDPGLASGGDAGMAPDPFARSDHVAELAQGLPGSAPDLGWGDLCQPLQIIPIGGTHRSILTQPLLTVLCGSIAQAIGDEL